MQGFLSAHSSYILDNTSTINKLIKDLFDAHKSIFVYKIS